MIYNDQIVRFIKRLQTTDSTHNRPWVSDAVFGNAYIRARLRLWSERLRFLRRSGHGMVSVKSDSVQEFPPLRSLEKIFWNLFATSDAFDHISRQHAYGLTGIALAARAVV